MDTVQTLLDHKADVNAKTNDGRAALYPTVRGKVGQTENDLKVLEMARLLLEAKAA